jgi:fructokinase
MTRVVSIGEALIDFKSVGDLAFQGFVGGSPFNVAVACSRLGAPVSFVGQLSTDGFGQRLREHLERNGVDTSLVLASPAPTTLAFVDERNGEPSYQFLASGSADRLFDPRPRPRLPYDTALVHFGSISLLTVPAATSIVDIVAAHRHLVIVFDPNIRPALIESRSEYLTNLRRWLELSRVVKLSAEDLRWLDDRPREAVLRDWFALGVEAVLVTDGPSGAAVYLANGVRVSAGGTPVEVVDTVGAGDTFSGAVLASLATVHQGRLPLDESSWSRILRTASRAAALNCTREGADPPTAAELESGTVG